MIGHSVALNFYNQKADRLLEDFRTLNNAVEGSGVFTEMVHSPYIHFSYTGLTFPLKRGGLPG